MALRSVADDSRMKLTTLKLPGPTWRPVFRPKAASPVSSAAATGG